MRKIKILAIYHGSDGIKTKALYSRLEAQGVAGIIAVNLFRACKSSERAKAYRGGIPGKGSYRSMAYGRKEWAMVNLCKVLTSQADGLSIRWGWGRDPKSINFEHVLYVDIPHAGQVSFHNEQRGIGPDYPGQWDGIRGKAPDRICQWCSNILNKSNGERHGIPAGTERISPARDAGAVGGGCGEAQQTIDI